MTDATDMTNIDKDIDEWEIAAHRHYTLTSTTFTKRQLRQLRQHEQYTSYKGEIITVSWSREHLENERDALLFIFQYTTIRVPRFLSFSTEGDVASITMEAVDGGLMDELAKMFNKEDQEILNSNVLLYINNTVLPQLKKLRSCTLGSLHGNIVPPYRLQAKDKKSLATEKHSIVVNPETLQVASIIDWELSGFFPEDFEFPFWLTPRANRVDWGHGNPAIERVIKLIDELDPNILLPRLWGASMTHLHVILLSPFSWLANACFNAVSNLFSSQEPSSSEKGQLADLFSLQNRALLAGVPRTQPQQNASGVHLSACKGTQRGIDRFYAKVTVGPVYKGRGL